MSKQIRCKSGVRGNQGKLQDNYDSFEEFERHSKIYNLHGRMGYSTPYAAWRANPTWSVGPSEFREVKFK